MSVIIEFTVYLLSRFDGERREEGPAIARNTILTHRNENELPVLDSAYVPWSRDRTIVPVGPFARQDWTRYRQTNRFDARSSRLSTYSR